MEYQLPTFAEAYELFNTASRSTYSYFTLLSDSPYFLHSLFILLSIVSFVIGRKRSGKSDVDHQMMNLDSHLKNIEVEMSKLEMKQVRYTGLG